MSKKSIFMHYVNQPKAEPEYQWHTIFSGSTTISVASLDGVIVSGIPTDVQNFRITGTYSAKAGAGAGVYVNMYRYTKEGKAYRYLPSSTSEISTWNLDAAEFWSIELNYTRANISRGTEITFDSSSGKLRYDSEFSSNDTDYGKLVITKIEALY